ncbi:hypothetical protein GCM10009642_20340 [Nocardiopsis metallicus]
MDPELRLSGGRVAHWPHAVPGTHYFGARWLTTSRVDAGKDPDPASALTSRVHEGSFLLVGTATHSIDREFQS